MSKESHFLDRDEIARWPAADAARARTGEVLGRTLARHGLDTPAQCAGRNWPIGCVALEITQRCNLDCTLCYLSDLSEAVHDLPLAEVFRRVDMIADHYGPGTDVQVTGGDPTLRRRDELLAIVRRIGERGMNAALFTNGIRASRDLLAELAAAGLRDVAFHVDMTQERKGFSCEAELDAVRDDYIARARGLGLRILFNTTVFDGNGHEMEALARYFIARADAVHLASFQLQAATGRGVLGARGQGVTQERMMASLARAAGCALDFELPLLGHPTCNRYTALWVTGGRAYPVFDTPDLFADLLEAGAAVRSLWNRRRIAAAVAATIVRRPVLLLRTAACGLGKLWRMRRDLVRGHGRVSKLSFMIHNFMDADALERDRCESCIFMTATADGPVSMCIHNARRDGEIVRPLKNPDGGIWNPLTGHRSVAPCTPAAPPQPAEIPLKLRKGRLRVQSMEERRKARQG